MAYQLRAKIKGKKSSSKGPLDLSRLFTTQRQQERYGKFFYQKKIMKPKYGAFESFPYEVFTFPNTYENLGLRTLICQTIEFYP